MLKSDESHKVKADACEEVKGLVVRLNNLHLIESYTICFVPCFVPFCEIFGNAFSSFLFQKPFRK